MWSPPNLHEQSPAGPVVEGTGVGTVAVNDVTSIRPPDLEFGRGVAWDVRCIWPGEVGAGRKSDRHGT